MRKIFMMAALITAIAWVPVQGDAAPLDVMNIVNKAEDALNIGWSGTRKVEMTIKDGEQITSKLIARAVHKKFDDGQRSMIVFLEPESQKGAGYVVWRPKNKTMLRWVYFPATRRVRKLTNTTSYDSFLGSDFTLADLSFKCLGGEYRLLDEENYHRKKAYKIEFIPEVSWYYSRIVSWVASDTFLPIKSNYYDGSGRLWKEKLFENIVVINNIPMALRVRMIDKQHNRSTEVYFSDVCYDVNFLSKETFNPEKIPEVTSSPVCTVTTIKKK